MSALNMRTAEKAVDEALAKAAIIEKHAILKGLQRIAEMSPVYTGRYKRNHRVAVNSRSVIVELFLDREEQDMVASPVDRSVEQILSEEGAKLTKLRISDNVIIGNAVPWANDVEQGTKTRPEGQIYHRGAQAIEARIRANSRV